MKKLCLLPAICLLAGCATKTTNDDLRAVTVEDEVRYKENIVVKAEGQDFVSYEYKNVRVDEIAPLAIAYCFEHADGKSAYLREIVLNKNKARQATFDCIDIAK